MLTKNAIGNLNNRYKAVLKKCTLMNVFGSLAVAGMFIVGGVNVAAAASGNFGNGISTSNTTSNTTWTSGGVNITGDVNLTGISNVSFGALNITSSGNVTLNATGSTNNSTLHVTDVNFSDGAALNLTVNKDQTLIVDGAVNTTAGNGTLTVNGTLQGSKGTLTFKGADLGNSNLTVAFGAGSNLSGNAVVFDTVYNATFEEGITIGKTAGANNTVSSLSLKNTIATFTKGLNITDGTSCLEGNTTTIGNVSFKSSGGILNVTGTNNTLSSNLIVEKSANGTIVMGDNAQIISNNTQVDGTLNVGNITTAGTAIAGIFVTKDLKLNGTLNVAGNANISATNLTSANGTLNVGKELIIAGAVYDGNLTTVTADTLSSNSTHLNLTGKKATAFTVGSNLSVNTTVNNATLTLGNVNTVAGTTKDIVLNNAGVDTAVLNVSGKWNIDNLTITNGTANINDGAVATVTAKMFNNGTLNLAGMLNATAGLESNNTVNLEGGILVGSLNLTDAGKLTATGIINTVIGNISNNNATSTISIKDSNLAVTGNITSNGAIDVSNSTLSVTSGIKATDKSNTNVANGTVIANVESNGTVLFQNGTLTGNLNLTNSGNLIANSSTNLISGTLTASNNTEINVTGTGTSLTVTGNTQVNGTVNVADNANLILNGTNNFTGAKFNLNHAGFAGSFSNISEVLATNSSKVSFTNNTNIAGNLTVTNSNASLVAGNLKVDNVTAKNAIMNVASGAVLDTKILSLDSTELTTAGNISANSLITKANTTANGQSVITMNGGSIDIEKGITLTNVLDELNINNGVVTADNITTAGTLNLNNANLFFTAGIFGTDTSSIVLANSVIDGDVRTANDILLSGNDLITGTVDLSANTSSLIATSGNNTITKNVMGVAGSQISVNNGELAVLGNITTAGNLALSNATLTVIDDIIANATSTIDIADVSTLISDLQSNGTVNIANSTLDGDLALVNDGNLNAKLGSNVITGTLTASDDTEINVTGTGVSLTILGNTQVNGTVNLKDNSELVLNGTNNFAGAELNLDNADFAGSFSAIDTIVANNNANVDFTDNTVIAGDFDLLSGSNGSLAANKTLSVGNLTATGNLVLGNSSTTTVADTAKIKNLDMGANSKLSANDVSATAGTFDIATGARLTARDVFSLNRSTLNTSGNITANSFNTITNSTLAGHSVINMNGGTFNVATDAVITNTLDQFNLNAGTFNVANNLTMKNGLLNVAEGAKVNAGNLSLVDNANVIINGNAGFGTTANALNIKDKLSMMSTDASLSITGDLTGTKANLADITTGTLSVGGTLTATGLTGLAGFIDVNTGSLNVGSTTDFEWASLGTLTIDEELISKSLTASVGTVNLNSEIGYMLGSLEASAFGDININNGTWTTSDLTVADLGKIDLNDAELTVNGKFNITDGNLSLTGSDLTVGYTNIALWNAETAVATNRTGRVNLLTSDSILKVTGAGLGQNNLTISGLHALKNNLTMGIGKFDLAGLQLVGNASLGDASGLVLSDYKVQGNVSNGPLVADNIAVGGIDILGVPTANSTVTITGLNTNSLAGNAKGDAVISGANVSSVVINGGTWQLGDDNVNTGNVTQDLSITKFQNAELDVYAGTWNVAGVSGGNIALLDDTGLNVASSVKTGDINSLGNLNVAGNLTAKDVIFVEGNLIAQGNLIAKDVIFADSDLTAKGALTANNVTFLNGSLLATSANVDKLYTNGTIVNIGTAGTPGTPAVNGTNGTEGTAGTGNLVSKTDITTIGGGLNVGGNITALGNFNVAGATVTASDVNVADLNVGSASAMTVNNIVSKNDVDVLDGSKLNAGNINALGNFFANASSTINAKDIKADEVSIYAGSTLTAHDITTGLNGIGAGLNSTLTANNLKGTYVSASDGSAITAQNVTVDKNLLAGNVSTVSIDNVKAGLDVAASVGSKIAVTNSLVAAGSVQSTDLSTLTAGSVKAHDLIADTGSTITVAGNTTLATNFAVRQKSHLSVNGTLTTSGESAVMNGSTADVNTLALSGGTISVGTVLDTEASHLNIGTLASGSKGTLIVDPVETNAYAHIENIVGKLGVSAFAGNNSYITLNGHTDTLVTDVARLNQINDSYNVARPNDIQRNSAINSALGIYAPITLIDGATLGVSRNNIVNNLTVYHTGVDTGSALIADFGKVAQNTALITGTADAANFGFASGSYLYAKNAQIGTNYIYRDADVTGNTTVLGHNYNATVVVDDRMLQVQQLNANYTVANATNSESWSHIATNNKNVYFQTSLIDAHTAFEGKLSGGSNALMDSFVLNNGMVYNTAGANYLNKLLSNYYTPDLNLAAQSLESTLNIANMGASLATVNVVTNAITDSVDARVNSAAATGMVALINENGSQLGVNAGDGQYGFGIWATPFYTHDKTSGLDAGAYQYGYSSSLFGISLGGDYTMNNYRVGLAFTYAGGDTKSSGDLISTKNDQTVWGFTAYGAYNWDKLTVTGDLGYYAASNDITQNNGIAGSLSTNPKSDTFGLGIGANYKFTVMDTINITPSVGIRLNYIKQGAYHLSNHEGELFHVGSDSATLVSFPIGVTVSTDVQVGSAVLSPYAELKIIPVAGNRNSVASITMPGIAGVSGETTAHVADPVTGLIGLGLDATITENIKLGLGYNFQFSNNHQNHNVNAQVRFSF